MVDKDNPDEVADKTLIGKLFDEVAPRYIDRPGGYTRIIHLAERRIGDAGKQVLLQLVEEGSGSSAAGEGGAGSSRRKRAARRAEAAKEIAEAADAVFADADAAGAVEDRGGSPGLVAAGLSEFGAAGAGESLRALSPARCRR